MLLLILSFPFLQVAGKENNMSPGMNKGYIYNVIMALRNISQKYHNTSRIRRIARLGK